MLFLIVGAGFQIFSFPDEQQHVAENRGIIGWGLLADLSFFPASSAVYAE